MDIAPLHTPVLKERTVELLAPALSAPGSVLVDGTLGMGGHAEALLERCENARVVGVDRDREALTLSTERLARHRARVTTLHTEYDDVEAIMRAADVERIDAVLLDLGVSSLQLDRHERGFSYAHEAPLDMRMDADGDLTAESVVNDYDAAALARIFWQYADEKLASRYARAIVRARSAAPIRSTAALAQIVADATPRAAARPGHPAKRVFQALRIEVNDELAVLTRALPGLLDVLAAGGRAVVLAYHSLEDRLVKREFAARTRSSSPVDLPVELAGHAARFRALTRGAEKASDAEQRSNSRAKPVRLRAVERVRDA